MASDRALVLVDLDSIIAITGDTITIRGDDTIGTDRTGITDIIIGKK